LPEEVRRRAKLAARRTPIAEQMRGAKLNRLQTKRDERKSSLLGCNNYSGAREFASGGEGEERVTKKSRRSDSGGFAEVKKHPPPRGRGGKSGFKSGR